MNTLKNPKHKFKTKGFVLLLMLLMLMNILSLAISANADSIMSDEKIYSTINIQDDFADDTILVVLTNSKSLEQGKFSLDDFPEIELEELINLDPDGHEQIEKQKIALKSLGLTAEELTNISKNTILWNASKDTLPEELLTLYKNSEYPAMTVPDDESVWNVIKPLIPDELLDVDRYGLWLIDADNFRASLSLKLKYPSKENVLEAIQILEKREDIVSASPKLLNFDISTDDKPETPNKAFAAYHLGDLNGDAKINASDARLALRASAKLENLSERQKAAIDIFFDSNVSAANARRILRRSAKIEALGSVQEISAELQIKIMHDGSKALGSGGDDYTLMPIINYYGTYDDCFVVRFVSPPSAALYTPPIKISDDISIEYTSYIRTIVWKDGEIADLKTAYEKDWLSLENVKTVAELIESGEGKLS